MKRTILLLLSVMMTIIMTAGNVTPEQALQQAQNFLQQTPSGVKRSPAAVPQLKLAGRVSGLYVFNAEGSQGFVIVSNDDRTAPILGYSLTGSIDPANMPCNMRAWLQGYADEIAWLDKHNVHPAASQAPRRAAAVKTPVAPLIRTHWDQDSPYNDQCPYYKDEGGSYSYNLTGGAGYEHCATGCVATAMAQVMYHNQWPVAATTAIPAYTWHGYSLELPATTFDWDNMQQSYYGGEGAAKKTAVATLMQYCGYSLEMDYDESSGSYTSSVATALRDYFDYAATVAYVSRSNYSYANWIELLYNELKQGRPVVYGGSSADSGHCFICDGYQGEDFFHINWGWGGTSDDYFKLSVVNPYEQGIGGSSSDEGFVYLQGAVVGIQKNGDTGTVLDNAGDYDLVDNGVTFSDNPTQYQEMEITATLGNEGPDDFDGDIGYEIWYDFGEDDWEYYNSVYGHAFIPAGGGTATVKFTPPYAGNYRVKIYASGYYILNSSYDLGEYAFSVADGSPVLFTDNIDLQRSLSVEGAEHAGGSSYNAYGTVFNGTLTVTNPDPVNTYSGAFQCDLYLVDGGYDLKWRFYKYLTILANGSIDIPVEYTGLENGKNYEVDIWYVKDGSWTPVDVVGYYTAHPGIVAYRSDGSLTVAKATSAMYAAPADILAVDISGAGITAATSAEPNCLFVIGEGESAPVGVGNVVAKSGSSYTADNIVLTDGSDFYSPVDFTATNIEFTYENDRWADGTNGWNTIVLPFDVTSVTANDAAIDWFHNGSDTGKQFWLKQFVSDEPGVVNFDFADALQANTPYIVAFPGDHWGSAFDLTGKTLKFIGNDVTVRKSTPAKVTGGYYRFVGDTKAVDTENIYCLNLDGNQFELTAGSAPFRAYFKGNMFDRTETSLSIGHGNTTSLSEELRVKSEEFATAPIYDLQGRMVKVQSSKFDAQSSKFKVQLNKGVYIQNGKLFIKK